VRAKIARHCAGCGLQFEALRRLWSILLLLAFALPIAAPALALAEGGESSLPACCRRGGVHHCAMTMGMSASSNSAPQWMAKRERCPYCPASFSGSVHGERYAMPTRGAVLPRMSAMAAGVPQAESRWRVARESARGKRGPPAVSLS
jgi:hypothetical protein